MGNLPGAKNFHIKRNSLKLNSTTAKTAMLMVNAAVNQKPSAEELGDRLLIEPPARSSASPSPLLPSKGDRLLPAHRHHGELPGEYQATGQVLVTKTSLIQSLSGDLRRYFDLHVEIKNCLGTRGETIQPINEVEASSGLHSA